MVQNPNSLLTKTFKSKYFPRTSILECDIKPHHSWVWKNIISLKKKKKKKTQFLVIANGLWVKGMKFLSIIQLGSL